jgi:hypothetical protein
MAQKVASRETGGDPMSSGNLYVRVLAGCFLAAGVVGLGPAADAASAGKSAIGSSASNDVIDIKYRSRGPRLYLPIVPYVAYDYPYYYGRGHYSKHIGPGYVYYGYPYRYPGSSYRRYRGR